MGLATDADGIESVRTVGARLESVFLALGMFFGTLVLMPVIDSCGLDGDQKILVVLAVDHRHETSASGKHAIDQEMLLEMLHRPAQIDLGDRPSS